LPITFWTFLIATIAIAGVPFFSGFFSKDEILYEVYASGHPWLWLIGTITSFLTAIYMFRVVFLTFCGDATGLKTGGPTDATGLKTGGPTDATGLKTGGPTDATGLKTGGPTNATGLKTGGPTDATGLKTGGPTGDHNHGAHAGGLHDAPPLMAIPLIVLAVGAALAGYVGVSPGLGGVNHIATFLEPSFTVERPPPVAEGIRPPVEHEPGAPGSPATPTAPESHNAPGEPSELVLMAVATVVALAGIAVSAYLFLKRREAAAALARRLAAIHRLLLHKYYVDEAYQAVIVDPVVTASEKGLWRGVDAGLIDGAVNGLGRLVRGTGAVLRTVQTGSIRAYAASLLVGVVLILAYLVWR
jgi:NADH-quinone oxidoreductase subunit L